VENKYTLYSTCLLRILALLVLPWCIYHPVFAYASVATPADADLSVHDDNDHLYDLTEDEYVSNSELYAVVAEIRDLLSGPLLASPSDAAFEMEDTEVLSLIADSDSYAVGNLPDRNVVVYDGVFGGQSCKLVFPLSLQASLWIDDSGYLFNVGSGNLVGRLFYTDQFDSSDYEYNLFTLRSVLTNTSSDIYRYGFPSYRTRYYRSSSSSSLANENIYGLYQVTDVTVYESDSFDYKMYCIMLVTIFLIGGVWLCLWKRSSSS
jgi:hypothetical protein